MLATRKQWISSMAAGAPAAATSSFERIAQLIADLQSSSNSRDAPRGRTLHQAAIQSGNDSNVYVASALINMYGKCRNMQEARGVFDKLTHPNAVCWNSLLLGYADDGQGSVALNLFWDMRCNGLSPGPITFLAAIRACTDLAMQEKRNADQASRNRGAALHLLASGCGCDSDGFVQTTLVDMYAKCGLVDSAYSVFSHMKQHSTVAWTALILGYADNGKGAMALDMFSRMRLEGCAPDARTFLAAFKACIELALLKDADRSGLVEKGKRLHLLASISGCDSDIFVENTLVDMYAKCGSMENAHKTFDEISYPDVVSWTALILGYAESGEGPIAMNLFSRMRDQGTAPNERTFAAVFRACTNLKDFKEPGKALHFLASTSGYDSCIHVTTALVDVYVRCASIQDARKVFDEMKHATNVSWTNLISGYAVNGEGLMALDLFSKMGRECCAPDAVTFIYALKACTDLAVKNDIVASRERGRQIHILLVRSGWESDPYVECTLVDMFAKCRCVQDARTVFDKMQQPDTVAWNALMFGYADNGEGQTALDLYSSMLRRSCAPNESTFLVALKACSMLGALEFGKGVHREICHCGFQDHQAIQNSLVDFYAKCGSLSEAENVFMSHASRNLVSWTALMAGYSYNGDVEGVFSVFDRMITSGFQPEGITFKCLLTACNHGGLVDKARDYFELMSTKYAVSPALEHYACILDILGRANKLDDAMAILRSMPFSLDVVIWTTILASCRKWNNVELGKLAFESFVCLDDKPTASYVLMANMFKCDTECEPEQETKAVVHS